MNEINQEESLQTLQNFDLSVVLLMSNRWESFIQTFPSKAKYYQRNGIELILVLNSLIKKELVLKFIKQYPMIDWKVIHVFNKDILKTTKQYLMVMDSGWNFYTDAIYLMRKNLEYYPNHYAIGSIIDDNNGKNRPVHEISNIRYGGFIVKQEYFETGDFFSKHINDNSVNLRILFESNGIKKLYYPEALFQKESNIAQNIPLIKKIDEKENDDENVIFTWGDKIFAKEQCEKYLSGLLDYYIPDTESFSKNHKLVALIPTYQEVGEIESCLRNVEKYCDGIIVLDDNSTDNTYELIQSRKLLLKTKKRREKFDDRQNRNILLDIAYFFQSEWFIFIDADERFDERFVDLHEVMKLPVDVVGVWIANLWDKVDTYRVDMIDSHPISQNGLWFRWRMFRNKGRMQIYGNNILHFDAVPYKTNTHISQSLLLHLGYLTSGKREKKYSFYRNEDETSHTFYNDILKKEINVEELSFLTTNSLFINNRHKTQYR